MIRALIFDVDGTLAETEEAHRQAFNETFARAHLNWHWSVADYQRLLTTTGGKERMRRYRQERGDRCPDDDSIVALHEDKTGRYGDIVMGGGLSLRPGVAPLIATARRAGLRLAVATTTNLANVDVLCRATFGRPAGAIFDVICAGDEVTQKKPAPDIYLLALERLNVLPEQALAFEDSRNGMIAAQAARIPTIVTPSLYTGHEDFGAADWLLPDLGTLPAKLTSCLSQPVSIAPTSQIRARKMTGA